MLQSNPAVLRQHPRLTRPRSISQTDTATRRQDERLVSPVPIAVGIQLICWAIGHSLGAPTRASIWIGCFASAAVCIMREITQREYQWIEKFGDGHRAKCRAAGGLAIWQWNAHSVAETAVAILSSLVLAGFVSYFLS